MFDRKNIIIDIIILLLIVINPNFILTIGIIFIFGILSISLINFSIPNLNSVLPNEIYKVMSDYSIVAWEKGNLYLLIDNNHKKKVN